MKYRIISKKTIYRGELALVPFNTSAPVPTATSREQEREKILLDVLFEISTLPEAPAKAKKARRKSRVVTREQIRSRLTQLAEKMEQKQKKPIAFYVHAALSVWGIGVVIALTAVLVFFGKAIIPHATLTIPSFIGTDVRELENTDQYELMISYENNAELAAGTVISQFPPANAQRKLFWGSDAYKIFLVVSSGKRFHNVPDLVGKSRRDALLELKNSAIPVNIVTQHSDSVETGCVIETIPPHDQKLYEGEILTLKISLGKSVKTVYVPSLFGMNESAASASIRSAGLKLGKITYQSSDIPAGKVISQQYNPFSRVRSGTSVDITVSLGNAFTQKYIPDLYGLTVEEAAEKLKKVGLVIGNIYAVSSGAPTGTVISQSPVPSTPITSAITSVDIYVSS